MTTALCEHLARAEATAGESSAVAFDDWYFEGTVQVMTVDEEQATKATPSNEIDKTECPRCMVSGVC